MRTLDVDEKRQRGCDFCQDIKGYRHCPHAVCPYHDLDEFTAFEEFCNTYPEVDLRELFRDI